MKNYSKTTGGNYMNSLKQKIYDFAKTKNLLRDEQASLNMGDASISIVLAAVTMGVGAMILGKISPQIHGSDEASDAMDLLPVSLVIFATVVIIGVVMNRANNVPHIQHGCLHKRKYQ